MRPRVSILLVSWNTRDLTLECLDSLPASVGSRFPYEVIVVDNGSIDGSAEALGERPDIVFQPNDSNRGYAEAVNQAYSLALGELILLLNSDVRFSDGSLQHLVSFLDEHPDIGGVGPIYLNPDGTVQQHHYRFPTFGMTMASASRALRALPRFERQIREYRMLDDDFGVPRHVPQPSASCLLLRRDVLPEGKLMDEQYAIYFNDVALARWLRDTGTELWVTPAAVVFHVHGASTRQLGNALKRQYFASLVRYLRATEPRSRVVVYRSFVFAQGCALRLARRRDALKLRELWRALDGDPGLLPQDPHPPASAS